MGRMDVYVALHVYAADQPGTTGGKQLALCLRRRQPTGRQFNAIGFIPRGQHEYRLSTPSSHLHGQKQ